MRSWSRRRFGPAASPHTRPPRWVSDNLGIQHDDLLQAAGFIGHPDAPDVTLNEAVGRYGDDPMLFTVYMLMLCGGLVATVGDADPDWLKQFDLSA